ncbi:MAG: HlyC/CorC family transporter [Deltaproteobacteria bacterium]|nr:MAG: HlyC/CorC family transporter [Deltaproteobacteria bacterium]
MSLLVLYVLLALGVSFLCSVLEAVLLSVTPSYVAARLREGKPAAETLRGLKDDIERPLAAILSLNTIAHTVGAMGAGAQAAIVFGSASVGLISGVLTFLILVFSEIIPKTLGARYWRVLAPGSARLLVPIVIGLWPLVKLSQGITHLLSRGRREAPVTRAEFTAMAELGERAGVLEAGESRVMKSLFRFRGLCVANIMTPRTVVFAWPEEKTANEVLTAGDELRFSRIPIYRENLDHVSGYVLKDTVLLRAAQGAGDVALRELKRDILVVAADLPLPNLFERLLERLEHIALVADEYGGTAGVVTLEDVVETLLGMEIVDEADAAADMQTLAREQWAKRAKRVGLVTEAPEGDDASSDAAIRLGLTGGPPSRQDS